MLDLVNAFTLFRFANFKKSWPNFWQQLRSIWLLS